MERVKGIEPSFSAWEADVLPLNYTRTLDSRQILPVPIAGRNIVFLRTIPPGVADRMNASVVRRVFLPF